MVKHDLKTLFWSRMIDNPTETPQLKVFFFQKVLFKSPNHQKKNYPELEIQNSCS